MNVVTFAPDARPYLDWALRTLQAHASFPGTPTALQSALAKMQGQLGRVALTFHLIELAAARVRAGATINPFDEGGGALPPGAMTISADTAERAARYTVEILLPHLLRAEALLGAGAGESNARWIAGFILASEEVRAAGRVTARDIQRSYAALRPPEHRRALENAMASLETAGWVRAENTPPGRPIAAWCVNPTVFTRFADRAVAERQRRDAARERVAAAAREIVAARKGAGSPSTSQQPE